MMKFLRRNLTPFQNAKANRKTGSLKVKYFMRTTNQRGNLEEQYRTGVQKKNFFLSYRQQNESSPQLSTTCLQAVSRK